VSKQVVRARLLDTLVSDVVLPPLPASEVTLTEKTVFAHNEVLRSLLSEAVCVEATNVARHFDENYIGGDAGKTFWSDLKCLVPPHRKFFIEWEQPRIPTAKRMGTLFLACTPELALKVANGFLGEEGFATPAKIDEFRRDLRCKWIYLTLNFLEFAKSPDHVSSLRGPYHIGTISVAEDGALLNFWMSHGSVIDKEESVQVGLASLVAWTTLSMLNCANIDQVTHHAPTAFQKARTRNGKKPLVSYHTVRVNFEKTPRSIAAEGLPGDSSTSRLHKKRGHMKDYRRGKGLFGRYKGIWYWGPALAGSEEEGVVVSDYEVRP
jgi:hypothetical protein